MVAIVQFRSSYKYIDYVMFDICDAAPHHSLYDWFWGVRCSAVEYLYLVSKLILLLTSYFITMVASITDILMPMATPFEH